MGKILFAGGGIDSVKIIAGTPSENTGGFTDATYADRATQCASSTQIFEAPFLDQSSPPVPIDVVTGETLFVHWEEYEVNSNVTVGVNGRYVVDALGQPWVAIRAKSANIFAVFYNSGTGAAPVWTQVGADVVFSSNARRSVDLKIKLGSPHSLELSYANNLVAQGTFTQALLTALRAARFSCFDNASPTHYSQIMATEGISTINSKVKYSRPTGAGANAGWTGAFGDVNEAVNVDATVNASGTAGQKQSYAMGDVTVPVGFVIASVFHWMRGKNSGIAPNNIKSLIRRAATDYVSPNLTGTGTSFGPLVERYDNDPNTAAPWTQANWNAAEAGYESAT